MLQDGMLLVRVRDFRYIQIDPKAETSALVLCTEQSSTYDDSGGVVDVFVVHFDAVDLEDLVALVHLPGALEQTALYEASDAHRAVLVLYCSTLYCSTKTYNNTKI